LLDKFSLPVGRGQGTLNWVNIKKELEEILQFTQNKSRWIVPAAYH